MPSTDPINTEANSWLQDQGRPSATAQAGRGPTVSPTGRKGLSSSVRRLAQRLGRSPDEVAENIPADTLRRSKYPVIEVKNPDGTITFKHDLSVSEGPTSLGRR